MEPMTCQKCRTPIRLDGSLEDLNPAAFKLLTESSSTTSSSVTAFRRPSRQVFPEARRDEYRRISQQSRSPLAKRTVQLDPQLSTTGNSPSGLQPNPAMSFVMLSESQVVQAQEDRPMHAGTRTTATKTKKPSASAPLSKPESMSQQVETTTKLFEILSARSDIDYPICVECTELLTEGLQRQLASVTRERDAYVDFLRQANSDIPTDDDVRQAEKQLKEAVAREEDAYVELERLEKEKATMDAELSALEAESLELDAEEQTFWIERNEFALKLSAFQDQRDSLKARYDHDMKQLQQLQRTNVYNDIFNIGHDGNFATINNLRLGRSDKAAVEWVEINAALGQTCLLLDTMADKLSFTFHGYELRPLGSTSSIYKLETVQGSTSNDPSHPAKIKRIEYPLYNTGDFAFGGLVGFHGKFDQAMVCFLDCVRQLGEHMENTPMTDVEGRTTPGPRLPYDIHKDKIGGLSIKLGFNQDDNWSKACKWMLTCCKFILARSSSVIGPSRKPP